MPDRSLDLDVATMRRLGARVVDVVAEHLTTLRSQPVIGSRSRSEALGALAGAPPEEGTEFEALLAALRAEVFPYAVREPHPGFMAYVPGCPTFPAVLGDWLATGYNFFAGVWPVAVGPNALELTVLDWFRSWLGMPAGSGGLLTTGGSNATLTALIAARHAAIGDEAGRLPDLTMYTSDQAHSSVLRAAWMAGLPRAHVRLLPTDGAYRIRVDALGAAIADDRTAGRIPLAVVATAGTTNTGAMDPLPAIADLCGREGIWMHVDAAYGGFAVLTERGRSGLAGLERADSVTLDPHKWLFVPFECGCLLVREPRRLKAAFQIMPEYLQDVEVGGERVNFADHGEQLTRASRALKVWLGVRYFGVAALRAAIDRAMDLAVYAEQRVRAEPALEVLSPAQLGIVCFRVHPPGMDDPAVLDTLNEEINTTVNASGRYFISSTRLRGAFSLRICVLGFRTSEVDVDGVIRAVVAAGEKKAGNSKH